MVLKFGTIGTAWITESYIECAQATGNWKLEAVYSRTEESAKAFAQKNNCSTYYTALEDLYSDKNLDAIYIASPNSLHFEQAKAALEAGKHVILEKAICSTLAEFDELTATARTAPNGARLIEAYRHIQEKNFKILKSSLGKVGKLYGAHLPFAQYSSRFALVQKGETPNVFSPKFSSSCITDMGVYPIAFALALFGKPNAQRYAPIMLHTGTDAGGPISLFYDTFTVTINTSKCYTSIAPAEIYGEKGTLVVDRVTDIDSIMLNTLDDKKSTQLAQKKPDLNLMEEAQEQYRLITENDSNGIQELEDLSRMILEVTTDLRMQNKIQYAADS